MTGVLLGRLDFISALISDLLISVNDSGASATSALVRHDVKMSLQYHTWWFEKSFTSAAQTVWDEFRTRFPPFTPFVQLVNHSMSASDHSLYTTGCSLILHWDLELHTYILFTYIFIIFIYFNHHFLLYFVVFWLFFRFNWLF